jgi:hypothetical protein
MAKYHIEADGAITEEGEQIGWVEGGTILHFKPGVEISGQARSFLEKQLSEVIMPEGKTRAEIFAEDQKRPEEQKPHASEIPPEPPQDPRLGDKTPAYMQWLGTYFPEKYEERYKGRRTHLNVGPNPHIQGGDVPESHFSADPKEEWK